MSKAATTFALVLIVVLALATAVQTARIHRLEQKYDAVLARTQEAPTHSALSGHDLAEERPPDNGPDATAGTPPEDTAGPLVDEQAFAESVVNKAIEAFLQEAVEVTVSPGDASPLGRALKQGGAPGNQATDGERGPKRDRDKARSAESSRQLANQARTALDRGEYAVAGDLLEKSIEEDPTNKQAYRLLAQMQHKLGLNEEEIQTYKNWIDAAPNDPLAHYQLAGAYERMGLDAEALQELERFGQMSQGNLSAYPMMASLYRRLDMRPEERQALDAWVQSASSSPDAHRSMGDFYRRVGNYNAALNEYEQVANLLPNNPETYINLGSAYQQLRSYDAAQDQFAAAVELRPNDLSLHMLLANAQRQGGDLAGAIQTYENIIALEPGSREALLADRAIARIERQSVRGQR